MRRLDLARRIASRKTSVALLCAIVPVAGALLWSVRKPVVAARYLAFSHDNRLLVAVCSGFTDCSMLYVWTTDPFRLYRSVRLPLGARSLQFVADDRHVAVVANGAIDTWSLLTGQKVASWRHPSGTVGAACRSPDGRSLAVVVPSNRLEMWDLARQTVRWSVESVSIGNRMAFTPDGSTLVGTRFDSIRLWSVATGHRRSSTEMHRTSRGLFAFSPDGRRVATASHTPAATCIWDTASGKLVTRLPEHPQGLVFAANHDLIVVSTDQVDDPSVWSIILRRGSSSRMSYWRPLVFRVRWHSETGRLRHNVPVDWSRELWPTAFSSDGGWLAGGSRNGTVHVWDAGTGLVRAVLSVRGPRWWVLVGSAVSFVLLSTGFLAAAGIADRPTQSSLGFVLVHGVILAGLYMRGSYAATAASLSVWLSLAMMAALACVLLVWVVLAQARWATRLSVTICALGVYTGFLRRFFLNTPHALIFVNATLALVLGSLTGAIAWRLSGRRIALYHKADEASPNQRDPRPYHFLVIDLVALIAAIALLCAAVRELGAREWDSLLWALPWCNLAWASLGALAGAYAAVAALVAVWFVMAAHWRWYRGVAIVVVLVIGAAGAAAARELPVVGPVLELLPVWWYPTILATVFIHVAGCGLLLRVQGYRLCALVRDARSEAQVRT